MPSSTLQDMLIEASDIGEMEPDKLAESYGGGSMSGVPKYNWVSQIPKDVREEIDDILTDYKPAGNFLKYNPKKHAREGGWDENNWNYQNAAAYNDTLGSGPDTQNYGITGTTGKGIDAQEVFNFSDWPSPPSQADGTPYDYSVNSVPNDDNITLQTVMHDAIDANSPGAYQGASSSDSWPPGASPDNVPRLVDTLSENTYSEDIFSLDNTLEANNDTYPHTSGDFYQDGILNWNASDGFFNYGDDGRRYHMLGFFPSYQGNYLQGTGLEGKVDSGYEGFFKGSGDNVNPGYRLMGLTDLFNPSSVASSLTEAGDRGTDYSWAPTLNKDMLKRLRADYYMPELKNARQGLIKDYQSNLNAASSVGKGFEGYGGRNRAIDSAKSGYDKGMAKEISNIYSQQSVARNDVNDVLNQWREML